jgi:hypothetical protein
MELFKLVLQEAKDQLSEINTGIRETRNKIFYMIGFIISASSYLSTSILKAEFNSLSFYVFIITFIVFIYTLIVLNKSVKPTELRLNGIEPNNLSEYTELNDSAQQSILHSYQKSITMNKVKLNGLTTSYKKIIRSYKVWLILTLLTIIFYYLTRQCFYGCS